MEVFDAIQRRKSVRVYDRRPIPDDVLMKILEAGRIAPSASNIQPWHFIVVRDQKRREALSTGRYAGFLKDSPVVIVGCGNKRSSPKWNTIDVTIALENMVLAATGEGVGTCWIGSFDEDSVKRAINAPPDCNIVAMLAVGYPRDGLDLVSKVIAARKRKSFNEVVSFEEFGKAKAT